MGYVNRHDERGKKFIAIDPPQAKIMSWAFAELAKGKYSTQQVFEKAHEMGLACKRNNFYVAIRNPVYCGKILIVKYKDEEAHTVKGLHEGIIAESLFYEVQDVLDGKKRIEKTKLHSPDMLPLRGFIRCSKCSRLLCGSASKGRNGYYYYYHCSSACGCRYKAEEVNGLFVKELLNYQVRHDQAELISLVIIDEYYKLNTGNSDDRAVLLKEIGELNDKRSKARDLLLKGDIDGEDYKTVKAECEKRLDILGARLADIIRNKKELVRIEPLLEKAISRLTRLVDTYVGADTYMKREFIGSMYPQKFTFEELQHRTAKVGDLFSCIYFINSRLVKKRRGLATDFSCLPIVAQDTGFEPDFTGHYFDFEIL